MGTLGIVLAASMGRAVVSAAITHEPVAADDFYSLFGDGIAARDRGDFEEAAELLAAAYRSMPADQRMDDYGRKTLREAVSALRVLYKRDQEPEHLRRARDLLAEHHALLDERRAGGSVISGDDAVLDQEFKEVEKQFASSVVEPREDEAAANEFLAETPSPSEQMVVDDLRSQGPPRRNRARHIALVATGAPLLTAGVVVLARGLRFPVLVEQARGEAQTQIDASGGALVADGWDAHQAAQFEKGKLLLGVGAATAGVGVALLAWGTGGLVKHRRVSLDVSAGLSRFHVGLRASGKF